jgi:hypothetical protein
MKRFILGSAALLLTVSCGYASLVTPRSLIALAQSADLIVVGTAGGTFPSSRVINFTVAVNRVVKGDQSMVGQTISVFWPTAAATMAPGATRSATGSGIWFFQQTNSQWVLIPVLDGGPDLDHAYFPVADGPLLSAYAYVPTAALTDRLASELASAIEGANGEYNFQLSLLQYGSLDELKSPIAQILYQRLSISAVVTQSMLGLSGLIRAGSSAALVAATTAEPTFASHPIENGILTQSIRANFRSSDDNSVAALGAASADSPNSNPSFREAAAHALASIHTGTSLPFLAALLDDPIAALRIEAIGGLGSFAIALPVQSSANMANLGYLQMSRANNPYRTDDTIRNFAMGQKAISQNETKYLSFWKNWWSQNRASLGY